MDSESIKDRLEIIELVNLYAFAADQPESQRFGKLFVPDGRLEGRSGIAVGWTEITQRHARQVAAFQAQGFRSVHMMLNSIIVNLNGDKARHVCKLLISLVSRNAESMVVASTGSYDDEVVRTEEGWRFLVRRVTADVHYWKEDGDDLILDLPLLMES